MARAYRLGELAERVGGEVRGDAERQLSGVATLEQAGPEDLSFLTNPRYRDAAEKTRAGALLVGPDCVVESGALLVVQQPYAALARVLALFHPPQAPEPGVSPDARVDETAVLSRNVHVAAFAVVGPGTSIGSGTVVGAGSVIGADCRVGDDVTIHPRAVLYPGTDVGDRSILHSGVVLGADGFGFATIEGRHHKVPQVGRVVVESDVEIGANTTIDRAMLGETRIGAGSKIDDLVMVAHGVRLGPGALLAGQAGIAGSARLGSHATLAGQAGVAGHLQLGDGIVVAAKSAVFQDLADGAFVAGVPAIPAREWKRGVAAFKRLGGVGRELRSLHERIAELERRFETEE